MRCTCRTSSLRIFVQSLTGFQISHSALVPRSVQLHGTTLVSSQIRHCYLTRSFSATTSFRSSQEAWQPANLPNLPNLRAEESTGEERPEGQQKLDDATAGEESTNPNSTIISTSAANLDQAKQHGAILDFSPEALESLVTSINSRFPSSAAEYATERGGNNTRSRSSKPAKPNDSHSRLKRHKIISQDYKYTRNRWDEEEEEEEDEDEEYEEYEENYSTNNRSKYNNPRNHQYNNNNNNNSNNSKPRLEHWQIQKQALKEKFPEGWAPRKRLSPDALDGIRALHAQFPAQYTTEVLARQFEVSAEAIRRILRGRWAPGSPEAEERRQERWFSRGKRVWEQMAALGKKPPRRWREEGIVRDPSWHERKRGGPRTEWPYMPRWRGKHAQELRGVRELRGAGGQVGERGGEGDGGGDGEEWEEEEEDDDGQPVRESSQRKLSENLF